MRTSAFLLLLTFAATTIICAESTPAQALLILSKRDQTLAIVDPKTLNVVARIPVGKDPHEVIASADGKRAYVSNYGFGAYNTLAVIDLIAQKALPAIDLGPLRGPHGLIFAGGKAWFTAEGAKAIGRYDPSENKVDWVLGTGQDRTHMIFVSDDLKRIIITNVSSGTVSVIEKSARTAPDFGPPPGGPGEAPRGPRGPVGPPGGDWEQTLVSVGRSSEGFDVSPDGREIWVATAQLGTVAIIDIASKRVQETIQANVAGANRLKFTPNGKLVFISGSGLTILDSATHKEIKRLDIGRGAGIQMQPDGSRAYVSSSGDNYVAVVDLTTLEITGRIHAGQEPDGLAWAAR
ncbi:MAG: YncE family protein [Acidobacteriaceae bacterium]|nr:YncE family protein [Acidobacteriaceae bacterium]MBV9779368.1 YncE family protein [Acidobacteriaceae bacterium]